MGEISLTVGNLDRSVAWYQTALGLRVHELEPPVARLGDGRTTVLELTEDAEAAPPGRHAGLYHYALLYPSRVDLARAALRLGATRTPIQGASDHGTHEAIYLPDADGLGIELAADRPRELWPTPEEEFGRGGPRPLDLEDLLATVSGEAPVDHVGPGLRVGHLHLHVGSIERGLAFYRDLIGFEVWALLPSAAFVSAGGYHHHLGFNIWRGQGVSPAPAHTVGLRDWTIQLSGASDLAAVRERLERGGVTAEDVDGGFTARDPWEIALRVVECGP
jgi:catechol 2,3-dioxygenase